MQFMFIVCDQVGEVDQPSPDDLAADERFDTWRNEVERRGGPLGGLRLRPAEEATTVRVRDGDVSQVPGPFSSSDLVMGGFDIVDCVDYHDALALAALHPCAREGAVEIRPVW
jgi:hypothetical protein